VSGGIDWLSTFLNLFFIPVLYLIIEGWREARKSREPAPREVIPGCFQFSSSLQFPFLKMIGFADAPRSPDSARALKFAPCSIPAPHLCHGAGFRLRIPRAGTITALSICDIPEDRSAQEMQPLKTAAKFTSRPDI
jgi:hypothetical protein